MKLKRYLVLRLREELAYLRFRRRGDSTGNRVLAAIFAQGRTGSRLLENLLSSTGHFRENGELLKNSVIQVRRPLPFLVGLSLRNPEENFLFRFKIYQMTNERERPVTPSSFLRSLDELGFRIIYLRRENVVKQALSNLIAEKRGSHHKYNHEIEDLRIRVIREDFERRVRDRVRYLCEEEKALEALPHLSIEYERDLESPSSHQDTVDRVLDFLGLERRPATTIQVRINDRTMEEVVVNYEEFVQVVRENGWERYLD